MAAIDVRHAPLMRVCSKPVHMPSIVIMGEKTISHSLSTFVCAYCMQNKYEVSQNGRQVKARQGDRRWGAFTALAKFKKHLMDHHCDRIVHSIHVKDASYSNPYPYAQCFVCPYIKTCGAYFGSFDHWFEHVKCHHQEFLGPIYGEQIGVAFTFEDDSFG